MRADLATESSRKWPPRAAAIAIPVKDEEDRIAACLLALGRSVSAEKQDIDDVSIVLLFNNCSDASHEIALQIAPQLPCRLITQEVALSPERGHAGVARRLAADFAAGLLGDDAAIFMTDADSEVGRDWVAAQARALRGGADVVVGRVAYDEADMASWPMDLRRRERMEEHYRRLLSRLGHVIDPDPFDVWPRHDHASGASLGFTLDAYRKIGGIPEIPLGEDRAFVAAAKRAGCLVRHDASVVVTTSGRMKGRAPGGAADTIRLRARDAHGMCDGRLEAAHDAVRRFKWRREMRTWHGSSRADARKLAPWTGRLQLPMRELRAIVDAPTFQALWQQLEERSPALARAPLPFAALEQEIIKARAALEQAGYADLRQTSSLYPAWRAESVSRAKEPIAAPNASAASSPVSG